MAFFSTLHSRTHRLFPTYFFSGDFSFLILVRICLSADCHLLDPGDVVGASM